MVEVPLLNEHKLGLVFMFARALLQERMATPVILVSWRSHRVNRVVVASASAAEATGV